MPTKSDQQPAAGKRGLMRRKKTVADEVVEDQPAAEVEAAEEQPKKRRKRDTKVAAVKEEAPAAEPAVEAEAEAEAEEQPHVEMTLLERHQNIVNTTTTLRECLQMLEREVTHFSKLLARDQKSKDKMIEKAKKRKREVNPNRKYEPSGFMKPVPVPERLLAFVDMGRDPTPADNPVARSKKLRDNWWEVERWINAKTGKCWRLQSNEPGAAEWVECDRIEMNQPQARGILSKYVEEKGLKDGETGSQFTPDKKLKKLLGEPRYKLTSQNEEHGYNFANLPHYIADLFKTDA